MVLDFHDTQRGGNYSAIVATNQPLRFSSKTRSRHQP